MIGVTSGGLLTALSGPAAAASTDIGGLGTALASDAAGAAGGRRWNGRSAGVGFGRRRVLDRSHVGAAQLGRRSRSRDPGGKRARHAGVAELCRRRADRGWRADERYRRYACGRQRRSR